MEIVDKGNDESKNWRAFTSFVTRFDSWKKRKIIAQSAKVLVCRSHLNRCYIIFLHDERWLDRLRSSQ